MPLAVFLATAAIGVWVAYDRAAAWGKFGMIAGAVIVYYLVAWQPPRTLWPLARIWALVGAAIAGYFLLTYDWQKWPADFGFLTRLGVAWMRVRPTAPGFLDKNVAGGLLAMLMPMAVAAAWHAWRERRWGWAALQGGLLVLTGVGLLFTSSRGAWGALAVAGGLWVVWEVVSRLAARRNWPRTALYAGVVALIGAALMAWVLSYPGGVRALVNHLPGPQDSASRYAMAQGAWRLVADFPYTGGGLGAFSGLYSTYILGIKVPLFTYSHDFFLDVALEQGLGGELALVVILVGSAWLMVRGRRGPAVVGDEHLLRWAVLAGLIIVVLHGLVDDALYGVGGTPLIFALAANASLLATGSPEAAPSTKPGVGRNWRLAAGGAALIVLVAALLEGRAILAAGYANFGAVQMAQLQLAGWPASQSPAPADYAGPQAAFDQAVALEASNRTAHQRLGLLAMQRGDFSTAASELETALRSDAGHRGVRKALGYSYVWLGQLDEAAPLLMGLPETAQEMDTYAWWWGTQGRADLAARATQMAKLLAKTGYGG